MGFVGNQIINMMVNKIKQNNPQMSRYLDELQNGANPSQVLGEAIQNGAITKSQFQQAKPMLQRYGKQMGINISQDDLNTLESRFNGNGGQSNNGGTYNPPNNNNGFRF